MIDLPSPGLQKGFALIELVIAVAIVGILAAISLPMLQENIAKSQIAAGLAEISPAKTNVEARVMGGIASNISTAALVGFVSESSNRCIYSVMVTPTGNATIQCILKGMPAIATRRIVLTRTPDVVTGASGVWTCSTSIAVRLRPKDCSTSAI
ncbi:pilin [Variovorax sp. W2I14]|uniref:pilin n=1 Tax=Variovorax sp. W2I14 TaxID=3042290 RepID=UPI003D22A82A